MKHIITGKKGSFAELITSYMKDTANLDFEFMLPSEINKLNEKHKVVYICIPFRTSWEYIMTDPDNNDLRRVFVDEVMEFRNLNHWDFMIDSDGGVDYKSVADKIIRWIRKEEEND